MSQSDYLYVLLKQENKQHTLFHLVLDIQGCQYLAGLLHTWYIQFERESHATQLYFLILPSCAAHQYSGLSLQDAFPQLLAAFLPRQQPGGPKNKKDYVRKNYIYVCIYWIGKMNRISNTKTIIHDITLGSVKIVAFSKTHYIHLQSFVPSKRVTTTKGSML